MLYSLLYFIRLIARFLAHFALMAFSNWQWCLSIYLVNNYTWRGVPTESILWRDIFDIVSTLGIRMMLGHTLVPDCCFFPTGNDTTLFLPFWKVKHNLKNSTVCNSWSRNDTLRKCSRIKHQHKSLLLYFSIERNKKSEICLNYTVECSHILHRKLIFYILK